MTHKIDPDLPMSAEGLAYHLNCKTADLADNIILVGDPNRVAFVGNFLDKDSIRFTSSNREINIVTGTYKGTPVSVVSTGMGTDNVEIVVNEIHAVKEFSFAEGKWLENFQSEKMRLIRVGTCGTPRPEAILGSLAITRHGIGMDNTCRYYEVPEVNKTETVRNCQAAADALPIGKMVGVYCTRAHPDITSALVNATEVLNASGTQQPYMVGTTASGSGFYGCQGRATGRFRGHLTVPNLVDDFSTMEFKSDNGEIERVVNIEMENSALCYLSSMLGYKAGTVCAIIAKRAGNTRSFLLHEEANTAISNAITVALNAIVT